MFADRLFLCLIQACTCSPCFLSPVCLHLSWSTRDLPSNQYCCQCCCSSNGGVAAWRPVTVAPLLTISSCPSFKESHPSPFPPTLRALSTPDVRQPPLWLDIVRHAGKPERLLRHDRQAVEPSQAGLGSVLRGGGGGARGSDNPPPGGPHLRDRRRVGPMGRGEPRRMERAPGGYLCLFSVGSLSRCFGGRYCTVVAFSWPRMCVCFGWESSALTG